MVSRGCVQHVINAGPELATQFENLDSYDLIFLGYPNWNADLPMPLYTFLEEYDFSDKTILPFTTHGGRGFSGTPVYRHLCDGAGRSNGILEEKRRF